MRILRHAIPVTLIVSLSAIAGVAYFNPFRHLAKLPIDPSKLIVSGSKITMEAPRLAGYTRDQRPYELTARAAAQDIANPGVIELKEIHAKVTMRDNAMLKLDAATGVYDTKGDVVLLKDDIVLSMDNGYTGRLQEATIDVKKGKVTSDRPVTVEMLNGTLNANNLVVSDSGDLITFGGGVVMDMKLKPPADAGKTAE